MGIVSNHCARNLWRAVEDANVVESSNVSSASSCADSGSMRVRRRCIDASRKAFVPSYSFPPPVVRDAAFAASDLCKSRAASRVGTYSKAKRILCSHRAREGPRPSTSAKVTRPIREAVCSHVRRSPPRSLPRVSGAALSDDALVTFIRIYYLQYVKCCRYVYKCFILHV